MHDSYRQEQAVGQINQNRDDLAEILNEIWFAHEQVGQLPTRANVWRIALTTAAGGAVVVGASFFVRCSPRSRLKFGAAAAADVSRSVTDWPL
jgi:hypothetical protein